jgi:hypothetical protein
LISLSFLASAIFLFASLSGYPPPNGSENNAWIVFSKFFSPVYVYSSPRGKDTAFPLLIYANKNASFAVGTYPHKTPGILLHASIIPCPEEHPVTTKSTV